MSNRRRARAGLAAAAAVVAGLATVASALPAAADPPAPARTIESAGNPIIADGSYYSADAAPLVVDDTLYIYTGHDVADPQQGTFVMHDYGVLATTDVEGGAWEHYPENLVPGDVFDWATGNAAYAGHAVEGTDGRFYWYVPVEWENRNVPNRMAIGVAVADTPVGPWEDAIGEPLLTWLDVFGSSSSGQEVIDPHVLIDDDGRVYLYWGAWNVARVVELEPTMTELKGEIHRLTGLTSFFEAPWVFKRDGTYYLAYDWKQGGSDCTPSNYQACIAYATADNPLGPWQYQGIILRDTSATTVHPSIIEFGDTWYITYHTKDAVGGGHFRRSVAIDEVRWEGDRMLPVVQTWADDPAFRLRENVAPEAEVSASYTEQPPMRLSAVNDGFRADTALLPPDQWGNYRGTTSTVPSDWVSYRWETPVRVDGVGIEFHRDSNWIRPPASWVVEYLDTSGEWRPVEGAQYPTATGTWHEVDFEPVTTSALRATFHGQENGPYVHSVSVSEWEVYAVQADELPDVAVWTAVGEVPPLPPAVRLPFAGGEELWVPVRWRAVGADAYGTEGTFTVEGRAHGQAAGHVTAVVQVGGTPPEPVADTLPPTVTIAPTGASGQDGWFSSDVVVRVTADDDTDYLLTVEARIDDGDWVTRQGVHHLDTTISEEGEWLVTGRARDASGNTSAEVQRVVRVDTTAPEVSAELDESTREVTVAATDVLSGVAWMEYRFDGAGAWQRVEQGEVVPAPDGLPHQLVVRAVDLAGNIATTVVDIPIGEAELEGNVAPYATPSASYTSSWENVGGLNDGSNDLFENNAAKYGSSWGTWNRAGQQWARLDWAFAVTVDRAGVWWYRDTPDTGDAGMIPPRSWVLQYHDGTGWQDVELTGDSRYERTSDGFAVVAFEPVTTRAMRIVAQAWGEVAGQGSIGIREWQVAAATDPGPELEVSVVADTRCVVGRAVVTTRVTNDAAVPVAVDIGSDFATRSVPVLAPGRSVAHAFTTRQVDLPAGRVRVDVSAEVGDAPVETEVDAAYSARSCG